MSDDSYFSGIALTKKHFSVHAADQHGKAILRSQLLGLNY
ncbi:hypothetical protein VAT7223_00127 [Vibrio atlanticus]|uniref:Transposase n=1 Tax=Vibrio atlanticus TaxID=693153 RepID=A0A1C3IG06_9VIBR|nr:hypothetical protein VAT7223_00127 [Vibrio atlanticus]